MTTEGQVRNFYPAMRIFIFGEDVTQDVTSCTVNMGDGRAPNTAEIVLMNAGTSGSQDTFETRSAAGQDRYIITENDIQALYPDEDLLSDFVPIYDTPPTDTRNEYLTQAASHIDNQIRERLEEVEDPIKRGILLDKFNVVQQFSQPDFSQDVFDPTLDANTDQETVRVLKGEAARYQFQLGDCVFQSNDPVRIFFRDPRDANVWYHMFSGFVSDHTDSVSEDNERLVTVRCEDMCRILKYARISTNPGIVDVNTKEAQDSTVLTFRQAGFAEMTLAEVLFLLIFGTDNVSVDSVEGNVSQVTSSSYVRIGRSRGGGNREAPTAIPVEGIGAFSYDRSMIVQMAIQGQPVDEKSAKLADKTIDVSNLGEYHSIVDHRVYESDIRDLIAKEKLSEVPDRVSKLRSKGEGRPPLEVADPVDVITEIGLHPELYPVDGGRLIMFVPKSLGATTSQDALLKDFVGPDATTDYRSRLSLIYDILENIDFSFYASPKGDLLCEMPLYQFDPVDFGQEASPKKGADDLLNKNISGFPRDPPDPTIRGFYESKFSIPKKDTCTWEKGFSDEHVRTQWISYAAPIAGYTDAGDPRQFEVPVKVTLKALMPQFGVRSETQNNFLIGTRKGALLYALIQMSKHNADARSANVACMPRVDIAFPNRPVRFAVRDFIGAVRSVQHSIVWNSSMDTTVNVNYIRAWSGQFRTLSDGRKVRAYEPLGGMAADVLNYNALLKGQKAMPQESTKPRTKKGA